jgi:hypothetical protein
MAELVDARDLGSRVQKTWGFESPSSHCAPCRFALVTAVRDGGSIADMRAAVVTLALLLSSCERTCDKPAAGCSCDGAKEMLACDGTIGLTCSGGEWKADDAIICDPRWGVNRD